MVQRMLASRFTPHAFRHRPSPAELSADLAGVPILFYRASAEVMSEVVGFHLNRGVLGAARRPAELGVADVLAGARTVACSGGVNDHEPGIGLPATPAGLASTGDLRRRLR